MTSFLDLRGNRGDDWLSRWNDQLLPRLGDAFAGLEGAAATSGTDLPVGTGAKGFVLDDAATLEAGVYVAESFSDPAKAMVVALAAKITASTDFTVTSRLAKGAGSASDWLIRRVGAWRIRPVRVLTGAHTVEPADLDAVLECSGGAAIAVALDAIQTLRQGFAVTIAGGTAGAVVTPDGGETVAGRASLRVHSGQAVDLAAGPDGDWRVVSVVGVADPHRARVAHVNAINSGE